MLSSRILKVCISASENDARNQIWALGAGYRVCSQLLGPPT